MKDHDVLIAVYTLQQEMNRRFDSYIQSNDERLSAQSKEVSEIGRTLIRLDGDIAQIKGMFSNLDERIDKLENKNLWMTVGAYIGVIVAGVIAWFKG
jgi:peptidoglycan hydrolase CwlO-like protein